MKLFILVLHVVGLGNAELFGSDLQSEFLNLTSVFKSALKPKTTDCEPHPDNAECDGTVAVCAVVCENGFHSEGLVSFEAKCELVDAEYKWDRTCRAATCLPVEKFEIRNGNCESRLNDRTPCSCDVGYHGWANEEAGMPYVNCSVIDEGRAYALEVVGQCLKVKFYFQIC